MRVILIDRVGNLGSPGDMVSVKSGYARNALIPQCKAIMATKKNIEALESRRAELAAKAAKELGVAEARAARISSLGVVVILSKSGDEGKLFGSIGPRAIAEAITAAGVEVSKNEIHLPEGALRNLGEFGITVQCQSKVSATVRVRVTDEK